MSAALAMPLDEVATVALREFFKAQHGRHKLPVNVQASLTRYFARRGESLQELATAVDVDDVEAWEEEWMESAEDAGVAEKADRKKVVRWLKEQNKPTTLVASTPDSKINAVVKALEAEGVNLGADGQLALQRQLKANEAGDARAQCTSALTVFLLYTLQAPSKEDEEWYEEQRRQVVGSAEFDPDGTMATIDIRRCKSYLRLLKDSSLPTLERALLKPSLYWADYQNRLNNLFIASGLPHAARMFMSIVAEPQTMNFKPEQQREYLWRYFFVDNLGRGFVERMSNKSAVAAMGSTGSVKMAMRPTTRDAADVLAENPALLQVLGLGGGGGGGGAPMCGTGMGGNTGIEAVNTPAITPAGGNAAGGAGGDVLAGLEKVTSKLDDLASRLEKLEGGPKDPNNKDGRWCDFCRGYHAGGTKNCGKLGRARNLFEAEEKARADAKKGE